MNDWRVRNASAREAPPLQPSPGGRRGLYIQDIHTLQVNVRKDHCNEAGEKPLCYVSAGSSGLIYTVYIDSTTRMTFSGQEASGFI